MTLLKLVSAFIRRQPLAWAFHILTLGLGVAVVTALLALGESLSDGIERDLAGIDLVVGAKGSPLQLILSTVFQVDRPTGNIPLTAAETLSQNRMVRLAVPVSLGDNVAGFRIVGTSIEYGDLYHATLDKGTWWLRPMEAVLGADVARRLALNVGDVFVGDHGLAPGGEAHKDNPYRVTGILEPTGAVIDRLVLTDKASVWTVHEHETREHEEDRAAGKPVDPADVDESPANREITALLIVYRSPMGNLMVPRAVAAVPDLQAASPAIETAHLMTLLGTGGDVIRDFGIGLLALSGLGFFVALFGAVSQRRRELALLRALGGKPSLLFVLVTLEGWALGLGGGIAGVALGRLAAMFASLAAASNGGPSFPLPEIGMNELGVLGIALALSLISAIAPAVMAYRTRPAVILRGI